MVVHFITLVWDYKNFRQLIFVEQRVQCKISVKVWYLWVWNVYNLFYSADYFYCILCI